MYVDVPFPFHCLYSHHWKILRIKKPLSSVYMWPNGDVLKVARQAFVVGLRPNFLRSDSWKSVLELPCFIFIMGKLCELFPLRFLVGGQPCQLENNFAHFLCFEISSVWIVSTLYMEVKCTICNHDLSWFEWKSSFLMNLFSFIIIIIIVMVILWFIFEWSQRWKN